MLQRTKEPRKQFNRTQTYQEKISLLEGAYSGQDCFILASGPSLGHVDATALKDKIAATDAVVMSVKQAYLPFKSITDFHFINDCNLPTSGGYPGYMYSAKRGPIVVASSGYPEVHARTRFARVPEQHWDIFCRVLDPLVYPSNNLGRLCENYEFERGTFDKMMDRPCGPSITLETVIYMAVHLGIKNIYAIGWDSGEKVGEHFYNEETHLTSNRNFEYELVQKGSGPLYNWLKERSIGLHLVSEVSALSNEIPRIKLKDI